MKKWLMSSRDTQAVTKDTNIGNQLFRRKAWLGLFGSITVFLLDVIAGFPQMDGAWIGRALYVFVFFGSFYTLCTPRNR